MNSHFWRWFYDRAAFAYDMVLTVADRLRLGSEGRIRREVIAKLGAPTGARILDLGCGTGANRAHLPSDIHYIGVDLSVGMLRRAAAKHSGIVLVQADAGALPFAGNTFDQVIAMGVLQHALPLDSAVREIWRVSREGGQIVLIDERHSETRIRKSLKRDNVLAYSIGEYFVLDLRN